MRGRFPLLPTFLAAAPIMRSCNCTTTPSWIINQPVFHAGFLGLTSFQLAAPPLVCDSSKREREREREITRDKEKWFIHTTSKRGPLNKSSQATPSEGNLAQRFPNPNLMIKSTNPTSKSTNPIDLQTSYTYLGSDRAFDDIFTRHIPLTRMLGSVRQCTDCPRVRCSTCNTSGDTHNWRIISQPKRKYVTKSHIQHGDYTALQKTLTDVSPAFEHHNVFQILFSTNKTRNKAKSFKINEFVTPDNGRLKLRNWITLSKIEAVQWIRTRGHLRNDVRYI